MSGYSMSASSASVSEPAQSRVLGKRKAAEKCRKLIELVSGKNKIPRLESPDGVPTTPVHGTQNSSNNFQDLLPVAERQK
jgi:hypothetical protein